MNKYIRKVASFGLSSVILLSTTPTFAASTGSVASDFQATTDKIQGIDEAQDAKTSYFYDVEPDANVETDVYLTIDDGAILVTIPNKIVLSGTMNPDNKYEGYYKVKVDGDFSGDKVVNVVPDETVELSQKGWTKTYTATIAQDKTAFTALDVQDSTNTSDGVVSAQNLTAGSWHGIFNFNINTDAMKNSSSVQYGKAIKSWNISATENDDVWMTYYQPEVATYSLDHTSEIPEDVQYADGVVTVYGTGESTSHIFSRWLNADDLVPAYEAWIAENPTVNEGNDYASYESINNLSFNQYFEDADFYSVEEIKNFNYSNDYILENYCLSGLSSFMVEYNSTSGNDFWTDFSNFIPKEIIITDSVESLGMYAFAYCNQISNITFNSQTTLKEIGSGCFAMTGIESVQIPNSVTKIGVGAFSACSNLKEVYIGENIVDENAGQLAIYEFTFDCCPKLEKMYFGNNVGQLCGSDIFKLSGNLTDIYLSPVIHTVAKGTFKASDIADGLTITCGSQYLADMLASNACYDSSKTTVKVDVTYDTLTITGDAVTISNATSEEIDEIEATEYTVFTTSTMICQALPNENGGLLGFVISTETQTGAVISYLYLFNDIPSALLLEGSAFINNGKFVYAENLAGNHFYFVRGENYPEISEYTPGEITISTDDVVDNYSETLTERILTAFNG